MNIHTKYKFKNISALSTLIKVANAGTYQKHLNISVSDTLANILREFTNLGGSALIVGGAVRDSILNFESKDVDIEVYGFDFIDILKILRSYGKAILVGKAFGVIKFKDPEGNDYDFSIPRVDTKLDVESIGELLLTGSDADIDYALRILNSQLYALEDNIKNHLEQYSEDEVICNEVLKSIEKDKADILLEIKKKGKIPSRGRAFAVSFDPSLTPQQAAERRDFTINAMAYDPLTEEIHDYFGGMDDLNNGLLRATSEAFAEDPLRVLRGMQFAARFGMTIEPETAKLAASLKHSPLVIERVSEEWMKMASKGKYPSKIFQYLIDTEWIDNYPELKAIVNLKQDSKHHPEGTADIHTALTMDAAAVIADNEGLAGDDRIVLILGALCHDLGKASTTEIQIKQTDEGEEYEKVTSYGHQEEGALLTEQFLYRLGIKKSIVNQVVPLVRHHMDHLWFDPESKKMNTRQIAEKLFPATIEQLAHIIRADMAGRFPLPGDVPDALTLMVEVAKQEGTFTGKISDLIRGEDLKAISPIVQQDKYFGRIITEVRNEQLKGLINTKEEAIEKAKILLFEEIGLIKKKDVRAFGEFDKSDVKTIVREAWQAQLNQEFSTKEEALHWVYQYLYRNNEVTPEKDTTDTPNLENEDVEVTDFSDTDEENDPLT